MRARLMCLLQVDVSVAGAGIGAAGAAGAAGGGPDVSAALWAAAPHIFPLTTMHEPTTS